MVVLNVLYPNEEGSHFDADYYKKNHIKMLYELLGEYIKGHHVDVGLRGDEPGSKPPYHAIARIEFGSMDEFQKAMSKSDPLMDDGPNYTNVKAIMQISELSE